MKDFFDYLTEDAPANNVGSGEIAGVGVSTPSKPANWGEPAKGKKKFKILRRPAVLRRFVTKKLNDPETKKSLIGHAVTAGMYHFGGLDFGADVAGAIHHEISNFSDNAKVLGHKIKGFSDYLKEAREDFETFKKNTKSVFTDHDTTAEHQNMSADKHPPEHQQKVAHAIVDHFATKADPTKDKAYTPWIMKRYKQQAFRQEDHPRIKQALTDFHTHKNKLQNKDINSYKKLSDVEGAVAPHLGTVSKKEEARTVKHEGADLIHSENGVTVHKLKTKEAACHYGAGTKWCTAATKGDNYFDHYHKQGPLYVVHTPEIPEHTKPGAKWQPHESAAKYQFHFQSNSFMDKNDDPVDLHDLTTKHPELKNVSEFKKGPHALDFAKDHDEFSTMAHRMLKSGDRKQVREVLKHPATTPEILHTALTDDENMDRHEIFQHPNHNETHVTAAMKSPDFAIRSDAVGSIHATHEHHSQGMADVNTHVRRFTVMHTKDQKHIAAGLADKDLTVNKEAMTNPHATEENINQGIRHHNTDVRLRAYQHPNATDNNLHNAITPNGNNKFDGHIIARIPHLKPEHLTRLLDHPDHEVGVIAAMHYNNNSETVHKGLDHPHPAVRYSMAMNKSPAFGPDHVTKALADPEHEVGALAMFRKEHIRPEHIDSAVASGHETKVMQALKHPLATDKHHAHVLENSGYSGLLRAHAINHASDDLLHHTIKNHPSFGVRDEAKRVLNKRSHMKEEVETGKFAGNQTFIVPTDLFHAAREAKKQKKHWTKYIGTDDVHSQAIRSYANKNNKKPIILQDKRTGAMMYARY